MPDLQRPDGRLRLCSDADRALRVGVIALGSSKLARVAVFLPKQPETVITMFGAARAGCVFVPVNPLLKPAQVGHILRDCNVRVLVTSPERLRELAPQLAECPDLRHAGPGQRDDRPESDAASRCRCGTRCKATATARRRHRVIDQDMVSIFYTSGSTGKPKGVVLSHRNMVTGAHSVAEYLGNTPDDRLLAVLPFSFDYGFSQLSTAFHVGASVVLMDYLFPRDILALLAKRTHHRPRGRAAAVGPARRPALAGRRCTEHLRYITNSGGAMPAATLRKLRDAAAADAGIPDVRPDRGVPLHLPAAGRDRQAPRLHGQGDSECGDPGRAPRRHALRAERAGRARASRLARRRSATGTIRRRPPSASSPCRARIRRWC